MFTEYDQQRFRAAAEALYRVADSEDPEEQRSWLDVADMILARVITALTDQQPSAVNPWQSAVDHERVTAHLGIAADNVTREEAARQLSELIDWHVKAATDPTVNGGFCLAPVQPTHCVFGAGDPVPCFCPDTQDHMEKPTSAGIEELLKEATDELAWLHRMYMLKSPDSEGVPRIIRLLQRIEANTGHVTAGPYPPPND